ncbi:S1C family serine protease [Mesoterricola silvestris]|uniref:Peptidase n=1 Tax=Mesoterricola silvestris TaxID=2927979 RepID=A0AA48GRA9_9BACT|nr:trypsin-like peptidase domain-containing protein [Mesoterricola silvestris]BDU74699.1 peptidase [Mesoterricola silvestris]
MDLRQVAMRVAVLLSLPLAAQEPYERPQLKLTPAEQETVDFNRKLAKPRTVTPRPALTPAERARADAFKRARNSVVFIRSITRGWYESTQGDQIAIPPASGTGFVWDNLGHVVTNHHVITFENLNLDTPRSEAEDLQVTLADGRVFKAVVIGRNLAQDIAVLHVFAPLDALKPLPIGSAKDLIVGQDVLAIGNPFGLDHTLTSGIVSGLGRPIVTSFQTHISDAIQTDAAINPGNSGGPLLDRAGRLVGMNTAITSTTGGSSGVGFAIPVETLNRVVPLLIAKGQTYRPVLGFATLPSQVSPEWGITRGIAVRSVDPGGIAEKAGLRGITLKPGVEKPTKVEDCVLGDVIIGINGVRMDLDIALMDFLEMIPPDQTLEFEVLREGKPMKILMKPGKAPGTSQKT